MFIFSSDKKMLPSTGSESKLASGPASGLASGPASKAQEKEMAKGYVYCIFACFFLIISIRLEPLNTVVGEIKLTSKDNQVFVVEKKHAYISKLIQTALENGK